MLILLRLPILFLFSFFFLWLQYMYLCFICNLRNSVVFWGRGRQSKWNSNWLHASSFYFILLLFITEEVSARIVQVVTAEAVAVLKGEAGMERKPASRGPNCITALRGALAQSTCRPALRAGQAVRRRQWHRKLWGMALGPETWPGLAGPWVTLATLPPPRGGASCARLEAVWNFVINPLFKGPQGL